MLSPVRRGSMHLCSLLLWPWSVEQGSEKQTGQEKKRQHAEAECRREPLSRSQLPAKRIPCRLPRSGGLQGVICEFFVGGWVVVRNADLVLTFLVMVWVGSLPVGTSTVAGGAACGVFSLVGS
ncbi:hypothetical protein [Streptomyces sp. CB02460]|uniref:hypothetical protein n=1 Tax=Streptomyces sp. CB02460 TaxID=1703941 RepID=UPI00116111C2|nr:hypothetical protein [Streptomyces sp. CB02460]